MTDFNLNCSTFFATRWSFFFFLIFFFYFCGDFKGFFWLLVACCEFCLAALLTFVFFLPTFNATLARSRLSVGQSHDSVLTAPTRSTQGVPSWSSKAVSKCVESTWHWDTVALVVAFVLFLWFAPSRPGIAARLVALPLFPLSFSVCLCFCLSLSSTVKLTAVCRISRHFIIWFFQQRSQRVSLRLSLNASRWVCFDGRI